MREPIEGLDSIFAGAAEQCEMVAAAVRNPDVDVSWVQRMAFEYLVRVLRVEAAESEAPSAARLLRAASLFERLTRDASLEAFEIARDWTCSSCGDTVPGRLAISGVRAREPKVAVTCAACAQTSPGGTGADEKVRHIFRDNLATGWNPRFNNFDWDGS
ncbi:MAG: hypothetical protein EB084_13260 [Proteobacteria bacterium]|nr:hypothetical protein [Pseudomonadota bacterium]